MARPIRKNADYHSHDKDMRNNPKLKAVRRRFKHEGYSIYNMMLELLTDSDGFTAKLNDLNIELWAGDFEIDPEKLREILEYCIKLELFTVLDGEIFSEGHIERLSGLVAKRNRRRDEFRQPKPEEKGVSDVQNPQSKVKKRKVNKSKVKESKENNNTRNEDASDDAPSVYKNFVSLYDQFIRKKINAPPKIDGVQGAAAKSIIAYLKDVSTDKNEEGAIASWKYILDNWEKLDNYHKMRLKLSEINSDIVNIIGQIKNGKKNGTNGTSKNLASTVRTTDNTSFGSL